QQSPPSEKKPAPFQSCSFRFRIQSAPASSPTWPIRVETLRGSPLTNLRWCKWVEMLKDMAPRVSRVAFLFNPQTAPFVTRYYQGPLESSARSLGMQSSANPVHNASEIESVITALAREPNVGLIVMPDSFNIVHRERIIALAAQNKLPSISPYQFMVAEGGLMSYGIDLVDLFRHAAGYVDRILKGEKPADLPVQAPTK